MRQVQRGAQIVDGRAIEGPGAVEQGAIAEILRVPELPGGLALQGWQALAVRGHASLRDYPAQMQCWPKRSQGPLSATRRGRCDC